MILHNLKHSRPQYRNASDAPATTLVCIKNIGTHIMLWSQIKLTTCDFSDLQITSEFDNRPGTGRFLRNSLAWSHIIRAAAGVGIWYHLLMPGWTPYVARTALLEISRTPYNARPIVHGWNTFSRAMMNKKISKFAIIPPKKQVV